MKNDKKLEQSLKDSIKIVSEFLKSIRRSLVNNIAYTISGIIVSLLVIIAGFLSIPFTNSLIEGYLIPFTHDLQELDDRAFFIIDLIIVILIILIHNSELYPRNIKAS